jgi:hypothetical protein
MPYGHISAAGLPVTGVGGALGISWLVAAGVTITLAGFALTRIAPRRSRRPPAAR